MKLKYHIYLSTEEEDLKRWWAEEQNKYNQQTQE